MGVVGVLILSSIILSKVDKKEKYCTDVSGGLGQYDCGKLRGDTVGML